MATANPIIALSRTERALAGRGRRVIKHRKLKMPQTQMFLRTAQTEQRIEALEEKVTWIMEHLKVPDRPTQSDEEWEAAAPKPQPIEWKEADATEPPKQSRIAERVAKGKRG